MVGEKTALWKDIIEKNKREMEEIIYSFLWMKRVVESGLMRKVRCRIRVRVYI